jgi:hypothetical protein
MQDQRAMAYERVNVEHPTLVERLQLAVEEAERRGRRTSVSATP